MQMEGLKVCLRLHNRDGSELEIKRNKQKSP